MGRTRAESDHHDWHLFGIAAASIVLATGVALATTTLVLWSNGSQKSKTTVRVTTAPVVDTVARGRPIQTSPKAKGTTTKPTVANASTTDSTTTGATDQTTTTTTRTPTSRSDALASALLGIAALLMLAGAFAPRITKLAFAGNTIELSPEDLAQVVEKVAGDPAVTPANAAGVLFSTMRYVRDMKLERTAGPLEGTGRRQKRQMETLLEMIPTSDLVSSAFERAVGEHQR